MIKTGDTSAAQVRTADRKPPPAGRRNGRVQRAHLGIDQHRTAPSPPSRSRSRAAARTPHRTRALETLRDTVIPATVGSSRRRRRRRGHDGELVRLQRADEACRAVRVRVRSRLGIHPVADDVPVDSSSRSRRSSSICSRSARGVRRAACCLPARVGKGLLGFDDAGGGRGRVPADLSVRDPVRALDRLPRLHPESDPRGLRRRDVDRRRGRLRHQVDGVRRRRVPRW